MFNINLNPNNWYHCQYIHGYLHYLDEFYMYNDQQKRIEINTVDGINIPYTIALVNGQITIFNKLEIFCMHESFSEYRNDFLNDHTINDQIHVQAIQDKIRQYGHAITRYFETGMQYTSNIRPNFIYQIYNNMVQRQHLNIYNPPQVLNYIPLPIVLTLPDFYRNIPPLPAQPNQVLTDWLNTFNTPGTINLSRQIRFNEIIAFQSTSNIDIYKIIREIYNRVLDPAAALPPPALPPAALPLAAAAALPAILVLPPSTKKYLKDDYHKKYLKYKNKYLLNKLEV
jgi:hypothetical protein